MGKIRTRVIGNEEEEKKQKQEQKLRSEEKKKKKVETEVEAETEMKVASVKSDKDSAGKKEKKEKKAKQAKLRVRGKKYAKAKESTANDAVDLQDAISRLKKIKYANFDESVELHLNVTETGIKGEVELPHSTGKSVRVRVVDDKLLEELGDGKINFDILVTHPSYMPKLAKYARVLGPKGLMPNPKAGTISPNPEEVVKKFEKGTLRWKTEPKFPLVHQMIGKISFADKDLAENTEMFVKSVGRARIQAVFIKTTMSPSFKLDIDKLFA